MENRLTLAKLSTGDTAYLYDKSIVLFFAGRRKVLSTSVYNGGYHEDFTAVYNRDMTRGAGMTCEMLAPTYEEHMAIVSRRLGLDAARVTGMGTAAQMTNAAVKSLSYEELTVTAIVTGGIETNGGRVGDPATYFKKREKPRPGTINIILILDTGCLGPCPCDLHGSQNGSDSGTDGGEPLFDRIGHWLWHRSNDRGGQCGVVALFGRGGQAQ